MVHSAPIRPNLYLVAFSAILLPCLEMLEVGQLAFAQRTALRVFSFKKFQHKGVGHASTKAKDVAFTYAYPS